MLVPSPANNWVRAFCVLETTIAAALFEPSGLGLTIILKALSAVLEPAVALKVNDNVVEFETSSGSPLITPLVLLSDNPPNEPDCKEYDTVSPSASVAPTVAWVPVSSSNIVARLPLAVVQLGAESTLIWLASVLDKPEVFVTFTP